MNKYFKEIIKQNLFDFIEHNWVQFSTKDSSVLQANKIFMEYLIIYK